MYAGKEDGMWIDILIGLWLLASFAWGLRYGLVRTAFGLGGLVAGVVLAGAYYGELARKMPLGDERVSGVVAFIVIFVGTFLVVVAVGFVLHKLLHWAALGWVDYLGGAALGLAIGGIIAGAALTAVLRNYPDAAATIRSSGLARFLLDAFPAVLNFLPRDLRDLLPKGGG